jgi:hypothetical protein
MAMVCLLKIALRESDRASRYGQVQRCRCDVVLTPSLVNAVLVEHHGSTTGGILTEPRSCDTLGGSPQKRLAEQGREGNGIGRKGLWKS